MKKIILSALLSLSIFANLQTANASNWIDCGDVRGDGTILAIDTDSIREIGMNRYAMWYKTTKEDGSYQLTQAHFDSRERAITFTSLIEYDKDGNVINSVLIPSYVYELKWAPVIPDTIGEFLYKCATETLNPNSVN